MRCGEVYDNWDCKELDLRDFGLINLKQRPDSTRFEQAMLNFSDVNYSFVSKSSEQIVVSGTFSRANAFDCIFAPYSMEILARGKRLPTIYSSLVIHLSKKSEQLLKTDNQAETNTSQAMESKQQFVRQRQNQEERRSLTKYECAKNESYIDRL